RWNSPPLALQVSFKAQSHPASITDAAKVSAGTNPHGSGPTNDAAAQPVHRPVCDLDSGSFALEPGGVPAVVNHRSRQYECQYRRVERRKSDSAAGLSALAAAGLRRTRENN